jgi:NAD-dependent deacetylase
MLKKKLVVLTGAGISAESGIKTFRDHDGLWEGFNIEDVATPEAWKKNPKLVLDFYNMRRKNVADAEPNNAHRILASLEKYFNVQIITQNVDDLHERANSSHVVHLHGELFKMRSEKDNTLISEIRGDIHLGDLAKDGGQFRPHIVWFGEEVPLMDLAYKMVSEADVFLIVGTSLLVYPAASLGDFAPPNAKCIIVDKKIPNTISSKKYTIFENPATVGMEKVQELLMSEYVF